MDTTYPETEGVRVPEETIWSDEVRRFAGETDRERDLMQEHVVDVCEEIDHDCDHYQNVIAEC